MKYSFRRMARCLNVLSVSSAFLAMCLISPWNLLVQGYEFESERITSPPVHQFELTISSNKTILEIDLSAAREQLREIATNRAEMVYFSVRDGRCPLKRTPSWQVYLSGTPDIELIRTNSAWGKTNSSRVCKTNPYYVGELKFFSPGAWRKKTTHTMFSLNRNILRSIDEAGGKAFAIFVLNPGFDLAQLAKQPVTLSDIGFEVQRVKSSSGSMKKPIAEAPARIHGG